MIKRLLLLVLLIASFSKASLIFQGVESCVACLGQGYLICNDSLDGTGCYDSVNDCPEDHWKTNILTQCYPNASMSDQTDVTIADSLFNNLLNSLYKLLVRSEIEFSNQFGCFMNLSLTEASDHDNLLQKSIG